MVIDKMLMTGFASIVDFLLLPYLNLLCDDGSSIMGVVVVSGLEGVCLRAITDEE